MSDWVHLNCRLYCMQRVSKGLAAGDTAPMIYVAAAFDLLLACAVPMLRLFRKAYLVQAA